MHEAAKKYITENIGMDRCILNKVTYAYEISIESNLRIL